MNGRGDVAPSCQDSERQFFRPTDDDPPLLEEVNRYPRNYPGIMEQTPPILFGVRVIIPYLKRESNV
jgi:hypothetical protein